MDEKRKSNPVAFWTDLLSGIGKNYSSEPLLELSQIHQQNFLKMYNAWIDCSRKLTDAGRAGDIEKLMKTSMESSGELYRAYGETLTEELTALQQCWKSFVPKMTMPGATKT
ncbi:MAG: hypothetical protein WC405_06015 [Syntrophales bacterium]